MKIAMVATFHPVPIWPVLKHGLSTCNGIIQIWCLCGK